MNKISFKLTIPNLIGAIILDGLLSIVLQFFWNYSLVSAVSGVNEISYLQSFGILILAGILTYKISKS